MEIQMLDMVELIVDLPNENLRRGRVGTVVEILENGSVFEVDFWGLLESREINSLALRSDQIKKCVTRIK